jgi:hypothetical protein
LASYGGQEADKTPRQGVRKQQRAKSVEQGAKREVGNQKEKGKGSITKTRKKKESTVRTCKEITCIIH